MKLVKRVDKLESKMGRIEGFLIYIAGAISIKFGGEAIPFLAAMING